MIGSEVDPVTNPKLEISGSRQFNAWLAQQGVSLAFTTYQTGKLFFIGLQADGRLSVFERTFNRAMGLWASPDTLYMSSLYQLWRFENALDRNQGQDGYDRLYVPQMVTQLAISMFTTSRWIAMGVLSSSIPYSTV
jgi:uncharacterized protein (TIGR03032 family)